MSENDTPLITPPRFRRRRYRRRVLVFILLLVVAGVWWLLPGWVARAVVVAPNSGVSQAALAQRSSQNSANAEFTRVLRPHVSSPPAVISVGILDVPQGVVARGTVFVLHGHRDRKTSMIGVGKQFARAGFRSVLVDLRGQGESTGDWLTYGVRESNDLSEVLDQLLALHMATVPVGVFGASYGGATAIQWAGKDPRICAVLAVAPFASMEEEVPLAIRHYLPGGRFLSDAWIAGVMGRIKRMTSIEPVQASAVTAIAQSRARVLLVHGRADGKIPCQQSERIRSAAPSRAELILLEGEDHDSIMQDRTGTIGNFGVKWMSDQMLKSSKLRSNE